MRTSEYAQLVAQSKILEAVLTLIKRARLQFVAQNLLNAEQSAVPVCDNKCGKSACCVRCGGDWESSPLTSLICRAAAQQKAPAKRLHRANADQN
jgi:hypothetical protein